MSESFSKLAENHKRPWLKAVVTVVALLAWVLLSFMLAQVIVILGLSSLYAIVPFLGGVSEAVVQFILTALVYLFTLLIVIGGAKLFKQRVSVTELGVGKLPSWLDIVLAPATFIGYLIVSSLVVLILSQITPWFDLQQAQEIGFENLASGMDLFMAFLALVIVAPIAEEILFRGYLYGKLRRYVGFIVAAVLTSALFGAVHMQWNVAIDTFVLSLAMCGLRELTGSIWAGTLVHMLKNGLAFFLLFIYPVIGS